MTTHPLEQLSAWLDGDLDPAVRAEVERHLAACAECRAVRADLEALRASAAAQAHVVATPSTDLWPGIAARLAGPREVAPPVTPVVDRPAPTVVWYRRRFSVGLPELALAASLAAAVGGTLLWPRAPGTAGSDAAPAPATAPVVAQLDSLDTDDARVTPVNFADAQFDAAVTDLERVLREQRDRLDPRTVIVLERNLRVIDDAIAEARQALATDPANSLLNAHLAGARQRKLELLRRAALITEGD